MSRIIKKIGEQSAPVELDQEDLVEIWGNSSFKSYYIRNEVIYFALECPVKMYLWVESLNPDTGLMEKKKATGKPGDLILLGSDKSIQIKAPDKMFNFSPLVLPTIEDKYKFLTAP